jgi:hypothetical protein
MKNPFGQYAPYMHGRDEAPRGHSASGEYQKQAVKDTEAMLQTDRRYELVCRKRLLYRGLLRLFSVFTGEQDMPVPAMQTIMTAALYVIEGNSSSMTQVDIPLMVARREPFYLRSPKRCECHQATRLLYEYRWYGERRLGGSERY